ncbi:MAG TPA: tyrosine-protein phosphatase, partial [Dehalococcoidales bacterium]|nr:tyrosine-protein phosphatase [Dehalococcoidales bacterium]
GKSIAWRRVYRSGELHHATPADVSKLKQEIKIKTIIDLRGERTIQNLGVENYAEIGARYFNFPLVLVTDTFKDMEKELQDFSNSAELYLFRLKQTEYARQIIGAFEMIADPRNHPVVAHCNAGKDRSGILSAILLNALGVQDIDIVEDYNLTSLCIDEFIARWDADPKTADVHKNLPEFQRRTQPETMKLFLAMFKKEYGTGEEFLKANGADIMLVKRLEKALLV